MKCPECIAEEKTSRVFPGGSSVTLLGHQPYYDEEGVYHSHDPNWFSTSYRCSNGHSWGDRHRNPCPTPGCEWGEDDG